MAQVSFKKGLLANLPAGINAGTVYVTTDERAIYMDLDESTRIRIGDFQEFKTLAALQANTNPSTSALYYVSDLNVLAKWTGTEYVQINLDTGATSAEVTGEGNAITGVSYDATTRKLTFTKATTFITPTEVDTKIGEADKSVRAYVDEKTKGIASDTALTALAERVTTAEADIDALEEKVGEKAVATQISEAIDALDLANTYDPKGAADGKDAAIAAAKKAGDDAQSDVNALKTKVGTVPDEKTVVDMISEAQTAAEKKATDLNSAMDTRVKDVEGKTATLVGKDANKSARDIAAEEVAKIVDGADASFDTLKEIADWISGHKTDAASMNSAIKALEAIVAGIGGEGEKATVVAYVQDAIAALKIGDYAKAADLTTLAGRVTTAEGAINVINGEETQEGSIKKALADAKADATEKANAAQAAAEKKATDLNGAMDTRVKAAESDLTTIKGEGAGSIKNALADAKAYADGLAPNYDAKGDANAALEAAKTYTNGLLEWGSF